jgi:hypothetical protein
VSDSTSCTVIIADDGKTRPIVFGKIIHAGTEEKNIGLALDNVANLEDIAWKWQYVRLSEPTGSTLRKN